jgi:hypothetical protein
LFEPHECRKSNPQTSPVLSLCQCNIAHCTGFGHTSVINPYGLNK